MMNLIRLMINILFQAVKIILSKLMSNLPNLSSIYKFTPIKSKTELFLKQKQAIN